MGVVVSKGQIQQYYDYEGNVNLADAKKKLASAGFNPLHWPMVGILRTLEPFAMDLWDHEIAEWLPRAVADLKKETSFCGLYQRLTITV